MGIHTIDGHAECELDLIAPLPSPSDMGIAALGYAGEVYGLGIDGQLRGAAPAGDAQAEREIGRLLRIDADRDCTIPGIARGLGQREGGAVDLHPPSTLYVEVHGHFACCHRVYVGAERGYQAGDVGRAAGAAVPDPAMMVAETCQRVLVEKLLAVE